MYPELELKGLADPSQQLGKAIWCLDRMSSIALTGKESGIMRCDAERQYVRKLSKKFQKISF